MKEKSGSTSRKGVAKRYIVLNRIIGGHVIYISPISVRRYFFAFLFFVGSFAKFALSPLNSQQDRIWGFNKGEI